MTDGDVEQEEKSSWMTNTLDGMYHWQRSNWQTIPTID